MFKFKSFDFKYCIDLACAEAVFFLIFKFLNILDVQMFCDFNDFKELACAETLNLWILQISMIWHVQKPTSLYFKGSKNFQRADTKIICFKII